MTVESVLEQAQQQILDEAFDALGRSHVRSYESAGESFTRQGLATLFTLVVEAIRHRDLDRISAYAAELADQRFNAGFGIGDVQTAFNALEESMWHHLVAVEPAEDLAEPIGLLSTVLGAGKDSLAREYVSLASHRHVTSLDLSALFEGTSS
jgi:hypothetical protein